MENAAQNTDRELWREHEGDYYSPSLFVTQGGGIGINVGGLCIVKPIREWHMQARTVPDTARGAEQEQALAIANMWLDGKMNSLVQMVPGDPDCDACVLARQYIRAIKRLHSFEAKERRGVLKVVE